MKGLSVPGNGMVISGDLRRRMEDLFGAGFGDVGLHSGGPAEALGVEGLAFGEDIWFAPGCYSESLLVHELTHILQQRLGRAGRLRPAELEEEAEASVRRVANGCRPLLTGDSAALGPPAAMPQCSGAPLALTDRPWAEIEREQRNRLLAMFTKPADEEPTLFEKITMKVHSQIAAEQAQRRLDELTAAKSEILLLTDRPWEEIEAERRLRVRTSAATTLQSAIRAYQARKELEQLRQEKGAITLQAAIRGFQARTFFQTTCSAIRIQSAIRALTARQEASRLLEEKRKAQEMENALDRGSCWRRWTPLCLSLKQLGEFLIYDTVLAGYGSAIALEIKTQTALRPVYAQDWSNCISLLGECEKREAGSVQIYECIKTMILQPLEFKSIAALEVCLSKYSITCVVWQELKAEQAMATRRAPYELYSILPECAEDLNERIEREQLKEQCGGFDIYPFFQGKLCNVDNGSGQELKVALTCTITITRAAWSDFVSKHDKVEATIEILRANPVTISSKSKIKGQRVIKPEPEGWCVASGGLWRLVDSTAAVNTTDTPKTLTFDSVVRFH